MNRYNRKVEEILLCFYSVKKINTDNMRLKFFFTIGWKNQVFYVFFFKFAKTIYTNKGFILSFIPKCCGIAHII